MRLRVCTVALFVLAAFLSGCSLDYGRSRLATEISEDTPDTILFVVTHTVVRDGVPRFIVAADRAETFGKRRRQYLHAVEFRELDAAGSTVAFGVADFAEYRTDTEDFELSGNLRFYSAEEDAWLTAEHLFWNDEARLLTSRPEDTVVLERGDGTLIRGRGFLAEMARSVIRFEDGVSGTLVESENSD